LKEYNKNPYYVFNIDATISYSSFDIEYKKMLRRAEANRNSIFNSYPYLDNIIRNTSIIREAYNKLINPLDRIKSRLYWYSCYHDSSIFHVSNIKNENGLDSYGITRKGLDSSWKKISQENLKTYRNDIGK